MRKEPSTNELSIHSNNFGGLNTTVSPINLPITDATELLNVDVDISGSLLKRRGTNAIYKTDFNGLHKLFAFTTNAGTSIMTNVYDKKLEVSFINADVHQILDTFTNVFKYSTSKFNALLIPGEDLRVLFLSNNSVPVQLTVHEYSVIAGVGNPSITAANDMIVSQTVADDTHVFVNNVYDPGATITYSAGTLVIDPSVSLVAGDNVSIIYFSWQWWAESEFYFGDQFQKTVPRFGTSQADKVVIVPSSIYSDLEPNIESPYGIVLYHSFDGTLDAGRYTLISTQDPDREIEYCFSDGNLVFDSLLTLTASTNQTSPTPFAVLFGREAVQLKYAVTFDDFLNPPTFNLYNVPGHDFVDGDFINLVQSTSLALFPDGISTFQAYVKRVNDNTIQLFTDEALTTPASTIRWNEQIFIPAANVDIANNVLNFASPLSVNWNENPPVIIIPFGTVHIGGTTFGFQYFITYTNSPNGIVALHFDRSVFYRVDLTSQNDSYIRQVRPAYIEKFIYDKVDFLRIRKVSFNDGSGAEPDHVKVFINDYTSITPNFTPLTVAGGWVMFDDPNDSIGSYAIAGDDHSTHITILEELTPITKIRIFNTENKWGGTACAGTIFEKGKSTTYRGRVYPAYGLGAFANYNTGDFPSTGIIHQERLFLGGFTNRPTQFVASATSDLLVPGEYYNYFQISDSLDPEDLANPFDVVLNEPTNAKITAMVSWQQLLFVFTKQSVYRSLNVQSIINANNRGFIVVSNVGSITDSPVSTDNSVYFLSSTGVFDLPLVFENEYRTQEISLKIRPEFTQVDEFSWIHYHRERLKVYVGVNTKNSYSTKLLIYDIRQQAWSEYYTYPGFNIYSITDMYDNTFGWLPYVAVNTECYKGIIRFYSEKFIDFTQKYAQPTVDEAEATIVYEKVETIQNFHTYPFTLYSNPYGIADIEVYYGTSEADAAYLFPSTDWVKLNNSTIKLLFEPDNNKFLFFVPNPEGSWYGTGAYFGKLPVRLDVDDFESFQLNTTCEKALMFIPTTGLSTDDAGHIVATALGAEDPFMVPLDVPDANTEYTINLPAGTCKYEIFANNGATLYVAYQSGRVAAQNDPYIRVPTGQSYSENDVYLVSLKTVYIAADTDDTVVTLKYWTSIPLANITISTGFVYPAEFLTSVFTLDVLHAYKRIEEISVWMTKYKDTLSTEDELIALEGELELYDRLINNSSCRIALVHNGYDDVAESSIELLTEQSLSLSYDWTLFREHLQQLGYSHQLAVFSNDVNTWVLAAYQIKSRLMSGSGYISGDQ